MAGQERDIERVLHGTLLGEAMLAGDVAALLADERGFYVAASDSACRLTGYPRDALTRFRAGELAADEESRQIFTKISSGKPQGRKLVRCADGREAACRYWAIRTTVSRLPYFLLLLWEPQRAATAD